ncbi:alginate lyase family protein [soil metagenome]
MSNFSWYLNRLKTMSVPEFGYRAKQYLQKRNERNNKHIIDHSKNDYNDIFNSCLQCQVDIIPEKYFEEFKDYNKLQFFGFEIDLEKPIDWHLDISSDQRFPTGFSKDINIRSDEFGSAKVVWEISRLQFLLPLCIKYIDSKDEVIPERIMEIIESWIKENPYLRGINWYSNIEVGIRLIVWYFCWNILFQSEEIKNNDKFIRFAKEKWLPSIYEHCVFGSRNPSLFSSANNHLVAEYAGLFAGSTFWKFKESKVWQNYSLKGLEKQFPLQYSQNGVNREETARYTQYISDLFLISYSIGVKNGVSFSESYKNLLYKQGEYILNLLDVNNFCLQYGDEDDGKVLVWTKDNCEDNFASILGSGTVLFGDERFKSKSKSFDLKNWLLWGSAGQKKYDEVESVQSVLSSEFYEEEGHIIFRKMEPEISGSEIYLHFDAAPLGFLSIAAHGHSDALSVALHVDGEQFLTDPGTYAYHTDKEWREYFVSAMAHNTICIDNKNQAEHAGPTLWIDHFKVRILNAYKNVSEEKVTAAHDGYKKIGCSHTRSVQFSREQDCFIIEDEIEVNSSEHIIYQPWHLNPKVEILKVNDTVFELKVKDVERYVKISLSEMLDVNIVNGQLDPILGWYSGSFLKKEKTNTILGTIKTNKIGKVKIVTQIEILR